MANPSTTPLLPLADIHLPEAPGFWPLAWGWWGMSVIVLLAVAFLAFTYW
ncbi:DUF4381 domain-containing protein, partial [Photobacterium japonica]